PMSQAPWLAELGFPKVPKAHVDLNAARLYEEALRRGEAILAADGALLAHTGPHTGRSVNDRFIVRDAITESHVNWGGANKGISPADAAKLRKKILAHLAEREVFVAHCSVGAAPAQRLGVRVVS